MAGKLIQYVESRITTRSNQGGSVNVLDGSNTRFGGTVMNLDITPNSSSAKIYVPGESSNNSNSANWFLYHSQAGNDVIVHNHNRSRYYGGGMKPSWQGGANHSFNIDLQAWVSLGNTTTTTFQIRTGCNGGAMTINGTGATTPTCYNSGHAQTLLYIMEFA